MAKIDEKRRQRFLDYSRLKYGGALDASLDCMTVEIANCYECGHYWYKNQPESAQLSAMYAAARSLIPGTEPTRAPQPHMIREMDRLRELVEHSAPNRALLDYGSGYGRWARAGIKAGFEVTAYEPSTTRGAEENPPFEILHNVEHLHGRIFAAINLEQVLEHIPDPLATLKTLREFSVPSTVVRITVPNLLRAPERRAIWDSWPFDGQRTHTMAPFEHLHGFTPFSLDRLLHRAGFKPLRTARLLRHYPAMVARSLLGKAFPVLGTTLQLMSTH